MSGEGIRWVSMRIQGLLPSLPVPLGCLEAENWEQKGQEDSGTWEVCPGVLGLTQKCNYTDQHITFHGMPFKTGSFRASCSLIAHCLPPNAFLRCDAGESFSHMERQWQGVNTLEKPSAIPGCGRSGSGWGGGAGDSHCGAWLAPWEGKRLCPEFFGSRESARAGMGPGKLVQHKHMTIPAGNPLAVPNPSAEQHPPGRLPGPPTLPRGNRKTSRQQQPWELEELSSGNNDAGREQGYGGSLTSALTMLRMRWIRAGNGTDPPAPPWLALLSSLLLHLSSQWDCSLVLLSSLCLKLPCLPGLVSPQLEQVM